MEIIDNFYKENFFNDLVEQLESPYCPYYINPVNRDSSYYQFTHAIYYRNQPESDMFELIQPLLEQLEVLSLIRAKVNLLPRTDKRIEHDYHIDIDFAPTNVKTAILYLNDNNGYTKFKHQDENSVNSKANRLVRFANGIYHTGSTNTCDEPYRLVLNIDYIQKNNDIREY